MKVALAIALGLVAGAVVGSVFTSGTCCSLVAQGVRSKFPPSVQSIGDALNIWPATIALANLGGTTT